MIIHIVREFCLPRRRNVIIEGMLRAPIVDLLKEELISLGYDVRAFFLTAPLETLVRRDQGRPKFKQMDKSALKALSEELSSLRLPKISTEGRTAEDVAEEILRMLGPPSKTER